MNMVVEEEVVITKKFKAVAPDGKKLEASSIEELEKLYAAEKEKWDKNREKREFQSMVDLIKENITITLRNTYPIITSNGSERNAILLEPNFYDSSDSIFYNIIKTSPSIGVVFKNTSGKKCSVSQNLRFTNLVPNTGKDMSGLEKKLKDYFFTEEFIDMFIDRIAVNFEKDSEVKEISFEDECDEFHDKWDAATVKKYFKMLDNLSKDTEIVNRINVVLKEHREKLEKASAKKKK